MERKKEGRGETCGEWRFDGIWRGKERVEEKVVENGEGRSD